MWPACHTTNPFESRQAAGEESKAGRWSEARVCKWPHVHSARWLRKIVGGMPFKSPRKRSRAACALVSSSQGWHMRSANADAALPG